MGKDVQSKFSKLSGALDCHGESRALGANLHAEYTISPENAYGGSVSIRPTHGPAYLKRWPTVDTLSDPTSETTTVTAEPTAKAESARRSSGGRGISGGTSGGGGSSGRRSGGIGGGGEGAKEHINDMAYNNAYVDGRWGLFQHAGAIKLITRTLASRAMSSRVADRADLQGLPHVPHQRDVQHRVGERG